MKWCSNCAKNIEQPDHSDGRISCSLCGRVLEEDNLTTEATFVKNAAGQSSLSGTIKKTVQEEYTVSERTLAEARYGMEDMLCALGIEGGDSIINPAEILYKIAVERNFTRGRKRDLVQASCLYIICRVKEKPYLLIDFSELIGVNVYVLGATFLKLCQLLSLIEHDFVQKPVDPSLFIHKFTDRLFGCSKTNVLRTALLIVASMKRDWMQTGRKPSGLCGAAIYISALSHGVKCSKSDIIKVVHICEATLTKRLIEFENTESGGLTIEEFTVKAEELKEEEKLLSLKPGPKASGNTAILCKHKDSEEPPFAHGLCRNCYDDFIKFSGGLTGGLEPPAFQHAERKRMRIEAAKDGSDALDSSTSLRLVHENELSNSNEQRNIQNTSEGAPLQSKLGDDSINNGLNADGPLEESETLSDIDDIEVDIYLHNEEEKELKKIVWEEMNKEYLEEQAAKEAAAKAAKEAYEAKMANCSENEKASMELAAAAAAAAAKSRKERQQKRAAELKNVPPPRNAAEATRQMLDRKKLGSRIRSDVLDDLFEDSKKPESSKKSRTDHNSDSDVDNLDSMSQEDPDFGGIEDPDSGGTDPKDPYINDVDVYDLPDW